MIYLLEDEAAIAEAVAAHLQRHGFEVAVFASAEAALAAQLERPAELLLVDVNLVDGEEAGFEFVRRIRAAGFASLVLMLTARDAVEDRVQGLDAGADDYLPKPFDLSELRARVHALLRRVTQVRENRLERGPLMLDFATREVRWRGVVVALTPREHDLLEVLARDPERIFGPDELLDRVWHGEAASRNVVRVYVYYLRGKLEPDAIVKTSGGYRLGV